MKHYITCLIMLLTFSLLTKADGPVITDVNLNISPAAIRARYEQPDGSFRDVISVRGYFFPPSGLHLEDWTIKVYVRPTGTQNWGKLGQDTPEVTPASDPGGEFEITNTSAADTFIFAENGCYDVSVMAINNETNEVISHDIVLCSDRIWTQNRVINDR